MDEKTIPHKTPKIPIELELSNEAVAFLSAMSEKMRLSPDAVVEHALQEKAEREGVVDEVRAREDLKEAFRRMGNAGEPNVSWSELKSGKISEAKYVIEFKAVANAEWKKLPLNIRMELTAVIDNLSNNPEPSGATELQGFGSLYRIRSGGYHITYVVQNAAIVILIIKSGKRG
jgi:mRNA-degrading endonuclease RelE of RelBE toxin-antitoxin system